MKAKSDVWTSRPAISDLAAAMILFPGSRKGLWNSCVPDVVLGTLLLVLTGPVIEAIIVEKG